MFRLRFPLGLAACVLAAPVLAGAGPLPSPGNPAAANPAQAILDADRAFAAKAREVGVGAAFQAFAADEVTLLNRPQAKVDRAALATLFPAGLELEWAPEDASVSADGTLGYSWGKARSRLKKPDGTVVERPPVRYVTIWRRATKDAPWRFVFDGGTVDPEWEAAQPKGQ
ncbi:MULTISPECIES: hypothetical protein [Nitrospirillum]|uniref:Ketosteroid isomerase-like protein n=1 Tax=Nitrospirillum amazonense TaxID=28077 RepID=A0A560FZA6_9PROT|nr:hypothetical protein [Nitrospirillum amazonense]MEC4594658.1 hypothetical protein [Nitrospirillum amazonense]TWB26968.1 hypothetical protein FBZ88_107135 [Nitrospirillum amazonense]